MLFSQRLATVSTLETRILSVSRMPIALRFVLSLSKKYQQALSYLGPIVRSMVSANHWISIIKINGLSWYLIALTKLRATQPCTSIRHGTPGGVAVKDILLEQLISNFGVPEKKILGTHLTSVSLEQEMARYCHFPWTA